MWYIFEKRIVQGCQKWYSHVSKAQIQKYKYTNTQTHKHTNTAYDKLPEKPTMWYISEKRIVQGCQKWYSHVGKNSQIIPYFFYECLPNTLGSWNASNSAVVILRNLFWSEWAQGGSRTGQPGQSQAQISCSTRSANNSQNRKVHFYKVQIQQK